MAPNTLTTLADGSKAFHEPGGGGHRFARQSDGTFASPELLDKTTLEAQSDGTFLLTYGQSKQSYRFTAGSGMNFLTERRDRNDNKIAVSYVTGDRLGSITDTQGRVTRFTYDANGHVAQMTDAAGRTYGYQIDADGKLLSYTDPAGQITRYAYDASRLLVRITSPAGTQTKLGYDTRRRITSLSRVTDPVKDTGPTTTFAYETGDTRCPAGTSSTVVTDPRANKTTHCWNRDYQVETTIDALGHAQSRQYTAAAISTPRPRPRGPAPIWATTPRAT
jgi:YD repeat-containing protein